MQKVLFILKNNNYYLVYIMYITRIFGLTTGF